MRICPHFQSPAMLKFWQILFWLMWLVLTVLFLLPSEYVENDVFDWWDKAQHALAFATLTIAANLGYRSRLLETLVALLAFGALIEVLQTITGWRQGDLADWVADGVGVLIASALTPWLRS